MAGRIAAILVSVVMLVSCGGTPAASTAPATSAAAAGASAAATPKAPADKVTLTGINSTELNLPTLVAIGKDYFAQENIELADFIIGSSGTLRQGLIAKQYDWSLLAFVHIPIARLAGSPVKAVIDLHDQEIFGIVVRSELKDQVKTIKDLKGKKVGFTTPGAGTWALGNVYIKAAGLDPEKDVQLVSLGGDNAIFYTALQTGRVDAAISFEPWATKVINDGVAYHLVDAYAPGTHKQYVGTDKADALTLATREDVIQSKPDLARRMVNVQKKALDFIRSNTSAAIADAILSKPKSAEQFQGYDRALVVKVIDHIKSGFGTGCVSKSGFDAEMKIALDYKLVTGPITYEQFADTQFAGSCP